MSGDWTETLLYSVLDASLRILIIAVAVKVILFAGRIGSARVSHAAWRAVLCAMLLMPVLPAVVPALLFRVPDAPYLVEVFPTVPKTDEVTPAVEGTQTGSPALPPAHAASRPLTVGAGYDRVSSNWGASIWPAVVLIVYGTGTLILFARLVLGWLAMQRIRSTHIEISGLTGLAICESSMVNAPMTIGVLFSQVILPVSWRSWPEDKLRAVLAHECSHVRGHDPLFIFLARVNCCLFWFHPVAWWLQKKLMVTAELACDDAGLRATGNQRRYAEILLEISDSVRRSGRRLSLHGVGMNGSGLMHHRIEQILRNHGRRTTSGPAKLLVAVGCAAAIFLTVACHPAPAPLQEDPETRVRQAREKERADFYYQAGHMSRQEAAALEELLQKNPEDLVARRKLLVHYGPDFTGNAAARRRHIWWFIEHHPEHEAAGSREARIFPTSRDPVPDVVGYAHGKKLWLRHTSKPDASTQVLSSAAYFLEVADKPLAEELLLRAQARDPNDRWSNRLGELYALALLGATASTTAGVVRSVNLEEAHSPYADSARKKLSESQDDVLVASAGIFLIRATPQTRVADLAPIAVGKSYLERALKLNPKSIRARSTLASIENGERNVRLYQLLKNVTKESEYQTIAALAEAERIAYLPWLAQTAFSESEDADHHEKEAAGKAARDRSRKYAEDMLTLAPRFRTSPHYANVIYVGNLALAAIAMREGNEREAVSYLRGAADAPGSDEVAYSPDFLSKKLLTRLLKNGERESVIQFLEQTANIRPMERKSLLESAEAIRNGIMPFWYLPMLANL